MNLLYEDEKDLLLSENVTSDSSVLIRSNVTRTSPYGNFRRYYGDNLKVDLLGSTDDPFFSINRDIFDKVNENIELVSDSKIQNSARQIVSLLEKVILPFTSRKLPKFKSYVREDGSFLFEWCFSHYRLGFSIENDIEESCWYFVSDETFGYFSASGDTQTSELRSIIEFLVPFVISKSFI